VASCQRAGTINLRIGVQGSPTAYTISNNIVGSPTVANSLSNATNSTTRGIYVATTGGTTSIVNNIIANLAATGTSTGNPIAGIWSQGAGGASITGNTVRNLSSASTSTAIGQNAAVIGIAHYGATAAGQILSQNTIHTLSNSAAIAAVKITGLYYAGPATGANLVERNFIHSLSLATTSTASYIYGIQANGGATTFQNNMLRLGINAAGASITTNYAIIGIYDLTGTNNFYFNSVYIGGAGVGTGTNNTFAFNSAVTINTRNFENNLFVNSRSNGAGTGRHVAARYSGTLPNPAGLNSNYNIYLADGVGAALIYDGATFYTTLIAWQNASGGQDANSMVPANLAQVNYVNPIGTSATVDLHVQSPTVVDSAGTDVASVTDDFDGETRASLTPVDIGADAGNYTPIDIAPPVISYTPLLNTASTANRSFTDVTVMDLSGVDIAAGTRPRLYFKRSTDGNLWIDNTNLTDGWKYVEASGSLGSPFDFTIDYSLLNGGTGVSIGTIVQYFVVAQDLAPTPNVSINAGVFAAQPASVALTSAAFPIGGTIHSYTILPSISGPVHVGPGELYPSLTNPGGLFEAINNSVVTGDIIATITGDLIVETGSIALNEWIEEGGSNFTLLIQPGVATPRLISGGNATTLITLNGADRVTFDGLNTGGNALLIRNTAGGATFQLMADASNNAIQNCTIESGNTSATSGVIFLSTGTTTGNDNNLVTANIIRDLSDTSGVPVNLVYSSGSSASIANTSNVLSSNTLKNFTGTGIYITSTGNESWTVTGNELFQEAARATQMYGIQFASLGVNSIAGNWIHDLNTTGILYGMAFSDARSTAVTSNRILLNPPGSANAIYGIYSAGSSGNPASLTLVNNQVTIIPTTAASQYIYGVRDSGLAGNTFTMYYNSVLVSGTAAGVPTWACMRSSASPTTFTPINNFCFNSPTGGGVNHFAAEPDRRLAGSWLSDHNLFVGTGLVDVNFMDWNNTAVTFASWQASSSGDANSVAGLAANISAANLFMDPAAGNLNVIIGALFDNAPIVSNRGTAIPGITTDYGGIDLRDMNRPDIVMRTSSSWTPQPARPWHTGAQRQPVW
jgi:hypothetical protein